MMLRAVRILGVVFLMLALTLPAAGLGIAGTSVGADSDAQTAPDASTSPPDDPSWAATAPTAPSVANHDLPDRDADPAYPSEAAPLPSPAEAPDMPAEPVKTPSAPGPAEARAGIGRLLETYQEHTGTAATDGLAPPGLQGLALLEREQAAPENQTSNATLPGQGTHSHTHASGGGHGLEPVWATPFHGIPSRALAADLDGDGVEDAVATTDITVTAVSGADGSLLWARHIGSTVSDAFLADVDGDGALDVIYSTHWQAQSPRIEALHGATGNVLWSHVGEASFLGLDLTGDGGIVAADAAGDHLRLELATGRVVWQTSTVVVPTTGAVLAGHSNLGHYLYTAADINGDGVADPVSAALTYTYAIGVLAYSINYYTLVHATDGATGEALWLHLVGDPTVGFADHILLDLDHLDSQGDGTPDVSMVGLSMRWPILPFVITVPTWESFLRVVDGDSTGVGVVLGERTIVSPLLTVEVYASLDRTDIDGDGIEEAAVLRISVVDSLLGDGAIFLERYAIGPAALENPTMALLSDIQIGMTSTAARLQHIDLDGDGDLDHAVSEELTFAGRLHLVDADGTLRDTINLAGDAPRAVARTADGLAIATVQGVSFAAMDGTTSTSFQMRGTPLQFEAADMDGDGTVDTVVRSTDNAIYVLDGLNGDIIQRHLLNGTVIDLHLGDVDGDDRTDLFLTVQRIDADGYLSRSVEAWTPDLGAMHWQTQLTGSNYLPGARPVWFDGNGDGVPDVAVSYDLFEDRLRVLDGVTGKNLWNRVVEFPDDVGTFWPDEVTTVRFGEQGEDLVLLDRSYGMVVVNGATGATRWFDDLGDGFVYRTCIGSADLDGDGSKTLFVGVERFNEVQSWSFEADGKRQANQMLPSEIDYLYRCDFSGVERPDGGDDLLVTYVYRQGDEVTGGFARYGPDGLVWDDGGRRPAVEAQALIFLGADTDAPDGGRFYYVFQDHVTAVRWSDAEYVGEYTFNGPFAAQGAVQDLDLRSPAEALVLSGDGILWALSEDAESVGAALSERAAEQGKIPLLEDRPAEKGLPAPGLLVAALAVLAALAVARRR